MNVCGHMPQKRFAIRPSATRIRRQIDNWAIADAWRSGINIVISLYVEFIESLASVRRSQVRLQEQAWANWKLPLILVIAKGPLQQVCCGTVCDRRLLARPPKRPALFARRPISGRHSRRLTPLRVQHCDTLRSRPSVIVSMAAISGPLPTSSLSQVEKHKHTPVAVGGSWPELVHIFGVFHFGPLNNWYCAVN